MSWRWMGVVLALGLAASPARGGSALEPPDLSRYLRWGPVRARPLFEITALGRDDNIFMSAESNRVADYTATLAPQVEGLVLLGSRAFVSFRERLEYTVYRDNPDQNYLNQRGSSRVVLPLSRIGFFADLTLDRVKERPADREDIRAEHRENAVGLGVILEPGSRTEIEIGRSRTDWRYTDVDSDPFISDRLDRTERGNNLAIRYRLLGRTHVTLDARVQSIEFENPFFGAQALDRNSRAWSLEPGLRFGEGGDLWGTARVGWAEIDARDPGLPDFAEVVGQAEVAYRLNTSTTAYLTARREPGFALFEDNTYFLEGRYSLRMVHYLNRVFGIEASRGVGKLTFPESTTTRRVDDIEEYEGGVRVRLRENSLGRRVEYSLRVGRYRRESNVDFDQSRNTLNFGAAVGF